MAADALQTSAEKVPTVLRKLCTGGGTRVADLKRSDVMVSSEEEVAATGFGSAE